MAQPVRNERNMWCQTCRRIRERDVNAGVNILFRTILALIVEATGQTGRQTVKTRTITSLLKEVIANPCVTRQQKIMFSDILRLLEGRSADTDWCLPGAHKPGRQNSTGGEQVGGLGVDGAGRNGPGPPNAATLVTVLLFEVVLTIGI